MRDPHPYPHLASRPLVQPCGVSAGWQDEHYWRGVDDERAQIAGELHDGLFGHLNVLALRLQSATDCLRNTDGVLGGVDAAREDLRVATDALAEAVREVRGWLGGQVPEWAAAETLDGVVRRLVAEVQRTHRTCCVQFTLCADLPVLPVRCRWELARIAQEALLNAARHGAARSVELRLEHFADDGQMRLCVSDDGCGFEPPTAPAVPDGGGFGLRAMRTRAQRLGGTLTIDRRHGGGTTVAVAFPTAALRTRSGWNHSPADDPCLDH